MVEIRVSVEDGSNAVGLVHRLAGLFGRSSISLDRSRKRCGSSPSGGSLARS
jgi:hypothetical protein